MKLLSFVISAFLLFSFAFTIDNHIDKKTNSIEVSGNEYSNFSFLDSDVVSTSPAQDVSGMFNERGFYKSNSITYDESEIINDFNGNLCYNIPLFSAKGPGDLSLNLSLNYNGSVNHQAVVADSIDALGNILPRNNFNAPGWIFSLNGMAIQMLNFETNFFTHPENATADSVRSDAVKLLATGYQITERLGSSSAEEKDRIFLMQGDGSVLTLVKISSCDSVQNCYIGEYYSENKNDYTRAVVKYADDNSYPTFRNRIVSVMRGDGLTFVYENYKNKYADYPHNWGSLPFRPQVFLLTKVRDKFGHEMILDYYYTITPPLSSPTTVYGRPLIKSITGGWHYNGIFFYYTTGSINIYSNNGRYKLDLTTFSFDQLSNHRPMITKITNPYDDEINITNMDYRRVATDVRRNVGNSQAIKLNMKLSRILSFISFNEGEREYVYADNNATLSIDMRPPEGDKIHSFLAHYKGNGRDMFFTNMLSTKKTICSGQDTSLETFTYTYNYYSPRDSGDVWIEPIDDNDNYYTARVKSSIGSAYKYSSVDPLSSKKLYKNFKLQLIPPVDPDFPDYPAYTKIIQEKYYSTNDGAPHRQIDYQFIAGQTGSYLDTAVTETWSGISKKIKYQYEHSSITAVNNSDCPLVRKIVIDPLGMKSEQHFKIFYDQILHYINAIYLYDTPGSQGYDSTLYYQINLPDTIKTMASNGNILSRETKEYHTSNSVNSLTEGYAGLLKKNRIYNGGANVYKETRYEYFIKDTTGSYLFPTDNSMATTEGNLKRVINPMGDSTKYFYHLIDTIYTSTDEYNQPGFKFWKMYEDGDVELLSQTWTDIRFPTIIQQFPKSNFHINNYKKYNVEGNVIKDINHYRYLSEYEFDALGRISTVVLPYDFSTDPNSYHDTTFYDTTNLSVNFIIKSSAWGYYNQLNPKNSIYMYDNGSFNAGYYNMTILLDGSQQDNIGEMKKLLFFLIPSDSLSQLDSLTYAFVDFYPTTFSDSIQGDTTINPLKLKIIPIVNFHNFSGDPDSIFLQTTQDYVLADNIVSNRFWITPSYQVDSLYSVCFNTIDVTALAGIENLKGFLFSVNPEFINNKDITAHMRLSDGFGSPGMNYGHWEENYSPRLRVQGVKLKIDSNYYVTYTEGTLKYIYDDSENSVEILSKLNSTTSKKTKYLFDGFYKIKQSRLYTSVSDFDSTSFKYNYLEAKAQSTDPSGNVTKYRYDEFLNIDSTANPDTSFTFLYDTYQNNLINAFDTLSGFINKKVFQDEVGNRFEKYYDAVGNLRREVKFTEGVLSVEDNLPGSVITDYRYDSLYRVSKVKTPEGKIIHYYYDGYGRQSKRITPDAGQTEYFYDNNDNLIFTQDANQRAVDIYKYTFKNYDGINRLTGTGEVTYEDQDSPQSGSQFESSSDDNYLTINVYDTLPNAIVNIFSAPPGYDTANAHCFFAKGNLFATAYRTRTVDDWNFKYYKYDVRGRVIKMWNIISVFDTLITEYQYNSQDMVTTYFHSGKGDLKTYVNTYDYAGRLVRVEYHGGAPDDPDPDLVTLDEYIYNENSQVSQEIFGGEYRTRIYYTKRNWISSVSNNDGMFEYTNEYFKNGNVKTQTLGGNYNDSFTTSADLNFSYTYDYSNRLLQSEKGSSYKLINTYDKDGNILTLKRYGATANRLDSFNYSYYSGTNKLKKVENSREDNFYDGNGNLTTDNLNSNNDMQYDYRNLITELHHHTYTTNDTMFITRYGYDESGNRIRKLIYKHIFHPFDPEPENPGEPDITDTTFWKFVKEEIYSRDISGREMAIYVNDVIEEYPIYGLDLIGKLKNGDPYYYYKDHLGSVRAVVNSSNQLVSAQDYDQWGYILQNRTFSSSKSKFKFTEKERDAESSYDYFGARYYDSRIANFGSVDPLLEKHFDFSPYTYVLRNPLIFIDPDGKQTLASEAIKYTIQTAKTVAPLVGVSLNPIGIILGSLINPSQLGQIAKHNEFLEEQRLWIEELNPRYTTDEIIITSLKSEGDLSKLSGKEVKELAKEEGYEGEKSVEKMKEQVLKDEGISSKEAKRFDVYKDKSTGKHYLKPKQEFEKKFKNKNIPID